jgi:hypothetical protein
MSLLMRRRSEMFNARQRRRAESQSDWYKRTYTGVTSLGGPGTVTEDFDVDVDFYTRKPVDFGVSFSVDTDAGDVTYTQGTRIMSAGAAVADEVAFLGRVYIGSWSIRAEIAGTVTIHYLNEWREPTAFLDLEFS